MSATEAINAYSVAVVKAQQLDTLVYSEYSSSLNGHGEEDEKAEEGLAEESSQAEHEREWASAVPRSAKPRRKSSGMLRGVSEVEGSQSGKERHRERTEG